jgi:3-methyladenine DNA glycosylase Tag
MMALMNHETKGLIFLCRMLFELLVLTGAQVGSDWTSVLKKREAFRCVLSTREKNRIGCVELIDREIVIKWFFFFLFGHRCLLQGGLFRV